MLHVYCNHALLWVHADQSEEGCHPGPESCAFMADLQMLATPSPSCLRDNTQRDSVYISGDCRALPERIFTRGCTSALPNEPAKRAFLG
jgi:hypothetical protein